MVANSNSSKKTTTRKPPTRRVLFGDIPPQGHRIGIYGPGGIGKSSLAATAPGPVAFFDLDDSLPVLQESLEGCDIRRANGVRSWEDLRVALHGEGWDDIYRP